MSKAIAAVKAIYNDCGITDPLELTIEEIIHSKNILIKVEAIEGADGRILMRDNSAIITINSDIDFNPKKRFILAHELGHFELHRFSRKLYNDNDETLNHSYQKYFSIEEVEANEFASEFLMPTKLFHAECIGKVFNPTIFNHLANRFQVSKTAAILKYAMKDNGNHPIFIVCCQNNKMKWFKMSHDWKYYSLFSKGLSPPTGSIAYEVFQNGMSNYNDEYNIIWKSDWFVLKKDEPDSEFFEYCFFVPILNYMISVIWEK